MTTLSGKDLYIDNRCIGGDMILTQVSTDKEYRDGKATDNIIGYKYTVVLPHHGFDHLDIKIAGNKLLDVEPGDTMAVTVQGLVIKPYVQRNTNKIAFTAKADGITPVKAGK